MSDVLDFKERLGRIRDDIELGMNCSLVIGTAANELRAIHASLTTKGGS